MKKILSLILIAGCIPFCRAQVYEDSLLRSSGFFFSPGVTDFLIPNTTTYLSNPRFGLSLGFRFKNEISHGFFLEGGVGITSFGTSLDPVRDTILDYYTGDTVRIWEEQNNLSHIHLTTPFFAGYRTTTGKVRVEAALGFAFNIKLFEFTKTYSANLVTDRHFKDLYLEPQFGTSFSALARVGISVPLNERATLDILPTLRYSFLYFMAEDKDILQCVYTDFHKWSAGIDLGFNWKLDNIPVLNDYSQVRKTDDPAFTISYADSVAGIRQEREPRKKGPMNFTYLEIIGNGLWYSHNYERTVFRKNGVSVQARAGFGIIPDHYFIPFGANVGFGHRDKKFELGIGATAENFTNADPYDNSFKVNLVPSMGFRYESEGHFFLRLALLSHYFFDSGELLPAFGVSVGGCF